jgi:hypothetical protein
MTIHTSFVPERVVPDELGHSNGVESQGSLYPTRSAFARCTRESAKRALSPSSAIIFEILVLVIVPSRVMYPLTPIKRALRISQKDRAMPAS